MAAGRDALRLVAPSARTRVLFFVLCVVFPLLVSGVTLVLAVTMPGDATPQLMFDSRVLTVLVPLAGVFGVGITLWLVFDRLMRRGRARLADGQFEVAAAWYRRRYALQALRLDEARVVDLDERTDLKPRFKRGAISTPGYRAGVFRLRDGQNAFIAMGSGPRVLLLPTTDGQRLLLEFENARAALDALRAAADSEGRAR